MEVLSKNNIQWFLLEPETWMDCGKIERHGRTAEENKAVEDRCCAKNLATLSNGTLYKCPFAANLSRIRGVEENSCDYCTGRDRTVPIIEPARQ